MNWLEIPLFCDGSSQVVYVTLIAYNNNAENTKAFWRTKSRRVVKLVQDAKIFGMADPCDDAKGIQHDIINILKKKRKIKVLTDSKELLNLIIGNTSNTYKQVTGYYFRTLTGTELNEDTTELKYPWTLWAILLLESIL